MSAQLGTQGIITDNPDLLLIEARFILDVQEIMLLRRRFNTRYGEEYEMMHIWKHKEEVFERSVFGIWMKLLTFKDHPKFLTPMAIALRNGNISKIIDVDFEGLAHLEGNGGMN